MEPAQLQELAKLIALEVSLPQWAAYLTLLVSAVFGVYVIAYQKKRGESKALQADFEMLKIQLVENTKASEAVRQALAGRVWIQQQQWARREGHYLELLAAISLMVNVGDDFSTAARDLEKSYDENSKQYGKAAELLKRLEEARVDLRRLAGSCALFLSDEAVAAVNQLIETKFSIAKEAGNLVEYGEFWTDAARQAYARVLSQAKHELAEIKGGIAAPQ